MRKLLIGLAVSGLFLVAAPAMAANGTIRGTVTRATNGTPIESAWIVAQNVDTLNSYYAVAGADGTYTVLSTPPGTYTVSIYSVYANQSVGLVKKSISVTVGDGEDKTGQNFVMTYRGRFVGHVYAADGVTPIVGATLTPTNVSGSTFGYQYGVTTSATGSYTTIPTPTDTTLSAVGSYYLTVSKTGYYSAQVSGAVLTGDDTDVTQDIRLTPASTVTGTVLDVNGASIASATVIITKNGGYSYTAATNAVGAYTVSIFDSNIYNGTAIGDYTMAISKTGYVTRTGRLSITADVSAVTSQNYIMTAGKVYNGTVVAKGSGAALAGAVVSLYNRNRTRTSSADFTYTTGSDGAFTFSSLPSGKYRITVTRSGYAMSVQDIVSITSDRTGVAYQLELGGSAKGLIYTGKSTPINGAYVGVYAIKNGKEMLFTSTTADETGNYLVTGLRRGTYKLHIITTDYVQTIATITVKNTTAVTKNIKLAAAGSVSGYLTDKVTGLPISGSLFSTSVTVKVVGTSITATPDSNGYFILDGIAPGTRKITVVGANYELPKQATVKVSANKTKTGVNFSLTPKQ